MLDELARFVGEQTDPQRVTSALQVAYQGYESMRLSSWGFPLVASIALFATTLLFLQLAQHIPDYTKETWLGREVRKFKGKIAMRKQQKKKNDALAADIITDAFEQAYLDERLSRRSIQHYYTLIGKALRSLDLIPVSKEKQEKRQRQHMGKLKATLKAKHGSKIVVLAKAREEQKKKAMTLTERVAAARRA